MGMSLVDWLAVSAISVLVLYAGLWLDYFWLAAGVRLGR
jgi:hypothetical protein